MKKADALIAYDPLTSAHHNVAYKPDDYCSSGAVPLGDADRIRIGFDTKTAEVLGAASAGEITMSPVD
jgi:hypothetical protein